MLHCIGLTKKNSGVQSRVSTLIQPSFQKKKQMVAIDAGTPPTDPLYDASHPDESKKKQQQLKEGRSGDGSAQGLAAKSSSSLLLEGTKSLSFVHCGQEGGAGITYWV